MTAALPMGSNKITGMADPTVSTDGATKNYVDTTTAAFFSTGDLKPTLKTVADSGWVMGGGNLTIGNVGSGATYANANAVALYGLIWNNISNPTGNVYCPVTGGLGASAAADWAALKPLSTGWYAGRALGFAGSGGSLTTRTLGSYVGEETHTLSASEIPTINSSGTNSIAVSSTVSNIQQNTAGTIIVSAGSGFTVPQAAQGAVSSSGSNGISVASYNTGGGAHNNMQPTIFVNVMIKL